MNVKGSWTALCFLWACVGSMTLGCVEDTEGNGDGMGGTPAPAACVVDGMEYPDGASVPAGDGCNTCECDDGMIGSCTEIGCPLPECTEEACGPAPGVPSVLCDDGVTMAGRGACERQENGQCGWTVSECPDDPCADILCADGEVCEAGACVELGPCEPAECGSAPPVEAVLCPDGETQSGLGPCARGADGVCGWTFVECPGTSCDDVQCEPDSVCVDGECFPLACEEGACGEPLSGTFQCPDGINVGGVGPCERQANGECEWSQLVCPDACEMIQCERGSMCVEGECVDDPERCVPGEMIPAGDGCNT